MPNLDRVFATMPSPALMPSWNRLVVAIGTGFVGCLAAVASVDGGVLDDIGFTELAAELGASLPTGAAIQASQIEAANSGSYGPDVESAEFAGKDFTFLSGTTGASTHATGMGQRIYGNSISSTPGISDIRLWEASDWLIDGFLKTNTGAEPLMETSQIQNHSWVGSMSTQSGSINALRRLDYAIVRDGFTAVVGVDNPTEPGSPLPELLSQAFNTISVGRSDGLHGYGLTFLDGSGRIKPELVAPEVSSSRSTARVSSAAALLIDAADSTAGEKPQTVKALLMAGATKDEFAGEWDRTSTRPLDDMFGAGELNIHRSHTILAAGEQAPGTTSLVNTTGWDVGTSANGNRWYFFEVPVSYTLGELSAILTWNRKITDSNPGSTFTPSPSLDNLNLRLYEADGFSVGTLLDQSVSSVDNVEHIYINADLGIGSTLQPGHYAWQVSAAAAGVEYALAWYARLDAVLGDMNLDGVVDFDDIDPFVFGLNNPNEYGRIYGIPAAVHGDINKDGEHDFDDINPFLDVLVSTQLVPFDALQSGLRVGTNSRGLSVAEPSTLAVLVGGLVVVCLAGRIRLRRGA